MEIKVKEIMLFVRQIKIEKNNKNVYISTDFNMLKPQPAEHIKTIIAWKSKRLSNKSIKTVAISGNSFASKLKWINNSKITVEFNGSWLKQSESTLVS